MDTKKDTLSEYDFDTIEIIKAGFAWIAGVKLQFVIALLIYVVIAVALQEGLSMLLFSSQGESINLINSQIIGVLSYPVLMPLIVGIMMMGLKHTRGEDISFKLMFEYYYLTGQLALAGLLIYVMTVIGFVLFIVPGIYLSVAYIYAPMLIVDKNMEVWEAMEHSRKLVTQKWFKIAGLMSILGLMVFFGTLAFGIGLIWAVPLMFITLYGLLYAVIFESDED
jgi:uncharacterized membrane protein